MTVRTLAMLGFLVLLAACDDGSDTETDGSDGSGASSSGPGSGPGAGPGTGPGAGSTGNAGGGASTGTASTGTSTTSASTTGAGGGVEVLPFCKHTCSAPSDCSTGTLLTDVDNWACTSGVCEYLGCQSTTECTTTYANPAYTCSTLPSAVLPSCNLTCAMPSSCATASLLTDADNWVCPSGICEYLGCQSTMECTATYANPNYVCD